MAASRPKRVSPEQLLRLQANTERIRNICILAHVDHGKTTLSDSLVSSNGIISSKLAGKLRFLDSTEDEQIRGITMHSSAISLLYEAETKTDSGEGADYLVNLIDSPGHIDFSSDVSTATRLCDGALVVIDVLEGVSTQTHAVLRKAWTEKIRPCLVLNKVDRLILELQLTPREAFDHLRRVVENTNAITQSLVSSDILQRSYPSDQADADASNPSASVNEEEDELLEKQWEFAPERGNVVFASALDGWGFALNRFANFWAKKLELPPKMLLKHMWGDFALNPQTKKLVKCTPGSQLQPMLVTMILEPIWRMYNTIHVEKNLQKAANMAKRVDVDVSDRDLNPGDLRGTTQNIFRKWFPLAESLLRMVVRVVPNPRAAQAYRLPAFWPALTPPTDLEHAQLVSEVEEVKTAIATCDHSPSAPVVVFVSKMMSIRAAELTPADLARARERAVARGEPADVFESPNTEVLIAFARVFAGTVSADKPLHVLGTKYNPFTGVTENQITTLEPGSFSLYILMGSSMHSVPHAHAGNIIGIAGIEDAVLKTTTLSSTRSCPSLKSLTFQATPMVRVAVEPVSHSDMNALSRGLAKLHQADPVVEVWVESSGEHVLASLGELHLEQCLKDLREKFARCEIRVSPPLVSFRETVVYPHSNFLPLQLTTPPWSDLADVGEVKRPGIVSLTTPNKQCTVTIQCIPLPVECAKLLHDHPQFATSLMDMNGHHDAALATADVSQQDLRQQFFELLSSEYTTRKAELDAIGLSTLDAATDEKTGVALQADLERRLLAVGPRNSGPNVFLLSSSFTVRVLDEEELRSETATPEGEPTQFHPMQEHSRIRVPEHWRRNAELEDSTAVTFNNIFHRFDSALLTGFQLATAAGPAMEEPMYGVCFVLQQLDIVRGLVADLLEDSPEAGTASAAGLTGQLISETKSACRLAFLSSPVRVVEAMYKCELQCDQTQLGRLYGVLQKRRGRVLSEDIIEGTTLFVLTALLPVVESFGFGAELLSKTSGLATSPQLLFSHWEVNEADPFWKPHTEEELEDLGEIVEQSITRKYVDDVRKRKGLPIEEKLVIFADKQRNLKRNK